MALRIWRWMNERWPLDALIRLNLEEEMVGGTSYAYVFGSCVLVVFGLQVITGIWQLLYFVPTIDGGYDSLNYLRTEVPFGWLIHGLHYWGASAMVILIGLHISQVYLWGAYKNPRQLTWLLGVGQLILTLALGFTGPVLPWDERGYWEAEVGTSMAGTVPLLGSLLRNLLRGGSSLGQITLSRFFSLHVAILPGLFIAFIGLHLIAFRQFGVSGPWDEAKQKRTGSFWPDQVFKDAVIITAIFVVLVGLSCFWRAPFPGPVDVMETFYVPKPEWYFLFLYQTLKAFPGRLEPVGTIGIPLFLVLLFLLLPFIDRGPERNPARRPASIAGFSIFVAWVITMVIAGHYSHPGVTGGGTAEDSTASARTALVHPADPPAQVSESVKRGAQGKGISVTPATKVLPPTPSPSPVVRTGPQGPPGPGAFIIGNVDLGDYLFKQNCASCHGPQGTDKVPNPGSADGTVPPLHPIDPELLNKDARTFVNSIDPYLQHGSIPDGQNPTVHMLPFGDDGSLTQQMIANVEAYVLHLNGVDRAQLVHPGIQPHTFFWLMVAVFGVLGLVSGGLWVRINSRTKRKTSRKSPGI